MCSELVDSAARPAQSAARQARLALTAALALVSLAAAGPARAGDDYGRLTLTEENDGLLPDGRDRHYTQGAMVTYLSPNVKPEDFANHLFDDVAGVTPFFQPGAGVARKFDVVVGQSIFTPTKYHDPVPDPLDRPFAGWLYTGGSLLQSTDNRMLENFEVLGGVVGPDALARQAQETFHSLAGFNNQNLDQGYRYQLRNEPGFMVTYERQYRVYEAHFGGFEADVIPAVGLTAGNVMTYASLGTTVRIGQNINVDYGVARVRPALSGTAWFDASQLEQDFGWYLFGGVQGRLVAHNIFLDGNTFVDSRSVDKNLGVADLTAGASVFYRDWVKLDAVFTERTKEFATQVQADHFGTVNLSFRF